MHSRTKLLLVALIVCWTGLALGVGPQRSPPDPERFEERILAFEIQDRDMPPPEGAIVFVGSSSIRFWDTLHEDMAPLTVINRGFGGSWMNDAVHYVDRVVINYRPRAIALYEGDNDVGAGGVPPEEFLAGFQTFVSRVHESLPETRIYFLAIKPSILRWDNWARMNRANELVRAECETDPLLTYVDVATPMLSRHGSPFEDIFVEDMLHMNAKGYAIWKDAVRPIMMEKEGAYER